MSELHDTSGGDPSGSRDREDHADRSRTAASAADVRRLVGADLNLLLVFDAIHRERSITRAASWLRVTQSAASHALSRLRTLTGDPLFVKVKGGVTSTPRADAMAPHVAAALSRALDALREPETFDPATATATVKLGLTDYASAILLPPLLQACRVAAPGIALVGIAIDTRDPLADLDAGEVDLVFGPFPETLPERFERQILFEEELVCLVAEPDDRRDGGTAGKRDRQPGTFTLDDYLARPHAVVSYTGDARTWADDLLAERGLAREIGLVLPHGLALRDAMIGTGLITTLIASVAARTAEGGGFHVHPHPLERRRLPIAQVWPRRLDADPTHAWVRRTAEQVHSDPQSGVPR